MKDVIIVILVILIIINLVFIYSCMKINNIDRREDERADKFHKQR